MSYECLSLNKFIIKNIPNAINVTIAAPIPNHPMFSAITFSFFSKGV